MDAIGVCGVAKSHRGQEVIGKISDRFREIREFREVMESATDIYLKALYTH